MEESMIGKKVKYRDETWEVVRVTEGRNLILARITVGHTFGVTKVDSEAVMVAKEEVEEIPNELTAKEYTEKLKAVLGYENCKNIDGADPEDEVCAGLDLCEKCPFYLKNREAVFGGSCEALMLYHPDLAVKLMDEWQEKKDKPKGKTYLEDIRERLPNVFINKFGIPDGCRKRLCNGIACTDCMPGMEECRKCWNEVMTEDENAEG